LASSESIFLIVGLGNPGPKYANTRHNVGFEIVDRLQKRWGGLNFSSKFQGQFAQCERDGVKVLLLKPQTYMNLSGNSVQEVVHFFKLDPSKQILIINDDLDLPAQSLRLRLSGGSGGNNGLKSIIECLGGEGFARLRVGIGRSGAIPAEHYVLGKFTGAEKKEFEETIERACVGIETILKEGLQKAMNSVNIKKEVSNES